MFAEGLDSLIKKEEERQLKQQIEEQKERLQTEEVKLFAVREETEEREQTQEAVPSEHDVDAFGKYLDPSNSGTGRSEDVGSKLLTQTERVSAVETQQSKGNLEEQISKIWTAIKEMNELFKANN